MDSTNKKYEVWIDDNYHAMMDPDSFQKYTEFDNAEDAIKKCKEILLDSLTYLYEDGMTLGDVIAQWAMFGDDPYIRAEDCKFSAREFLDKEIDKEAYFDEIKKYKNAKQK
ncbi:MAG: hypothetical protein Q7J54_00290 [Candidatus Woesearchaeota archaeon]|nr:hypothetical protein [Candidatus Woesearchaeota archaeon]